MNGALGSREIENLVEAAEKIVTNDVIAREGPAGRPRKESSTSWRIRIIEIGTYASPRGGSWCADSAIPASKRASVYAEAISNEGHAPEARFVDFRKDPDGNWRSGLNDSPCLSIPASYYF